MAFEEFPWYMSTCNACKCVDGESACNICILFKFKCSGTCVCCEDYRKSLPSTSRGLGPSSVPKEETERICDHCKCLKNGKSCRICVRGSYKCIGTCPCCSQSREKTNITVCEKDMDNIIRNSLLTHIQCNDKSVLLVPLETFNTITGASTAEVSPTQYVQLRQPPEPTAELSLKKKRRILCTQCFCDADNIPCQICCFKDVRCRGACPCCHMKSTLRFLNPDESQMFEPICPRCTRTPGEGICDHCREVAEESAAALEKCRPKRGRRPKPAILTHKKKVKIDQAKDDEAKNEEAKGDQANDVEPPTESKEKEKPKVVFVPNDLQLLDQSYVKDEYCLNCQCRRGKEPCNSCKNSPCYGKCKCCVEFNRQLLENPIENPLENHEPKEEQVNTRNTGAVMKKRLNSSTNRRSQLVTTVDCQTSTSQMQADPLYDESLKCEKCNCIKYCRPCEDCSDMDMGCTFPVDEKLCLCCSIRL